MPTPEDRYRNDIVYNKVTRQIEAILHQVLLTPSEVRECAMLACIHYELRKTQSSAEFPPEVIQAIETLDTFRNS